MLRSVIPSSVLFGLDISDAHVRRLRSEGFDVSLTDIGVELLPFRDDFFDLCLMFDVIEHLFDPDHALDEVRRVLKRRTAFLVLKTPNLAFWINRFLLGIGIQPLHTEVSTRKVLGRRYSLLGQGDDTVGHIRVFTLPALLDMVAMHHFTVEQAMGFPNGRLKGLLRVIDSLLSECPSLSDSLLLVLTKTV